jgi:hypothetical protein
MGNSPYFGKAADERFPLRRPQNRTFTAAIRVARASVRVSKSASEAPLILSFSPRVRLGELATPGVRRRMRMGEGTREWSSYLG